MNKNNFESVFVRGFSRSGGTMLTTILDSHHDISMSYELYPNILKRLGIDNIILGYDLLKKNKNLSKFPDLDLFNTYFARTERSGIQKKIFLELLKEQISDFKNIEKLAFGLTKQLSIEKMKNENKKIWGAKCSQFFKGYINNYNNPFIFSIIRDGRDVCVSQLKNLKRESQSIEKIAKGWVSSTKRILDLNSYYQNSHNFLYEEFVNNPKKEINIICNLLNIDFDENMLKHNEQNLTIYKSNHISMPNLIKPINNEKVGVWKKELSINDIKIFNQIAKEYLKKFDYEI
jgi:hypothetical protein